MTRYEQAAVKKALRVDIVKIENEDPFRSVEFARRKVPNGGFLTTSEVSKIAGLSLRQLQWYDEQEVLRPIRIENHKRLYALSQVPAIQKLAKMRKAGVSLHQCRKLLKLKTTFENVVSISRPTIIDGTLVVPR